MPSCYPGAPQAGSFPTLIIQGIPEFLYFQVHYIQQDLKVIYVLKSLSYVISSLPDEQRIFQDSNFKQSLGPKRTQRTETLPKLSSSPFHVLFQKDFLCGKDLDIGTVF